ncbi:hypothetical protein B0H21DRAFT_469767 [Amylocystis lapponica]|nr:hypothetical protein B0H21DRAFT_469767 [Amylocystis lapponica]
MDNSQFAFMIEEPTASPPREVAVISSGAVHPHNVQSFEAPFETDSSEYDQSELEDSDSSGMENKTCGAPRVETCTRGWLKKSMKARNIVVRIKKTPAASVNPSWWTDPRFAKFKAKVLRLDPDAEFSRKDRRKVRCSRCTQWTEARNDNDLERFKDHRKGKTCNKKKGIQPSLSRFFAVAQSADKSNTHPIKAKPSPCPGLSYNDHPRIPSYLARTVVLSGGAPPRHKLKAEILMNHHRVSQGRLTKKQLTKRILAAERVHAIWLNHHTIGAVFSPKCKKFTQTSGDILHACEECMKVLRCKTFRTALRRTMPRKGNSKFTPKAYRNPVAGEAYLRHRDVQELMEMDEGKSRWLIFAKRGVKGRYKNHEAFLGMMDTVMKVEDRLFRGKKITNIKYDAAYDSICTMLALLSPRAYALVQAEFGGRSLRSMSRIRAKHGQFQPGIVDANFDEAAKWAASLDYHGPFVLATDDTKVVSALRSYQDNGEWRLGGMHGEVKKFDSYEELMSIADISPNRLAEKTRAWLLTIPLPGIPPKLVATMPICNKVARPELRAWHDQVEQKLMERGLHIVSYNVDGVQIERGMTHDIENDAILSGDIYSWTFEHPLPDHPPLIVHAPILANRKPRIGGTDRKHAKRNGRGSATSGARVLVLGPYLVHYGQLAMLAESKNSPLMKSDIVGVDKQDDRAAARLFSSAVIDHISITQPGELGLATYLFIVGEIVDAQQNRSLSHIERVKMLWRGKFFLDEWHRNIMTNPYYSINTHFITRELYDIFSVFINAMFTLILTHRDFFPDVPLLPWLNSTETCEHFFGCARKIQKDFTFVEWLLMIPKLSILMAGELRNKLKGSQKKAATHRHGYHHTWFDTRGIDLATLSSYPSDAAIEKAITVAHQEAYSLLNIIGMTMSDSPAEVVDTRALAAALRTLADSEPESHDELTADAEQLERLLRDDVYQFKGDATRPTAVDEKMTMLGIAATAAVVHDYLRIDNLPEETEDDKNEWRAQIQHLLNEMDEERRRRREERNTAASHSAETPHGTFSELVDPRDDDMKPLDFGSATAFKFSSLVQERARHETKEAKSAITYRYRQAVALGTIEHASDSDADPPNASEPHTSHHRTGMNAETSKLKADLVTEMTRALSAAMTSTGPKQDTSGVERQVRWKGIAAVASQVLDESIEDSGVGPGETAPEKRDSGRVVHGQGAASTRSAVYGNLEKHSQFAFISGGVSVFHPLKPGSWVAVGYLGKLFFGQVKILYVKGGGKRPTHNYTASCPDVSKISRIVVLQYSTYGDALLSPLSGARQQPTYLFLHQEHLITSLDALCPNATDVSFTFPHQPALSMLTVNQTMWDTMRRLDTMKGALLGAVDSLLKEAAARRKRTAQDGDGDEVMPDGKRVRAG